MEFDENKYYLGTLCKRGHEYKATGKSLRCIRRRACVVCEVDCQKANRERRNESQRKRYWANIEESRRKGRENQKGRRRKNPDKLGIRARETAQIQRNSLAAYYIKHLIQAGVNKHCNKAGMLHFKDITPELIELKRAQLKAFRASQAYKKGKLT